MLNLIKNDHICKYLTKWDAIRFVIVASWLTYLVVGVQ